MKISLGAYIMYKQITKSAKLETFITELYLKIKTSERLKSIIEIHIIYKCFSFIYVHHTLIKI